MNFLKSTRGNFNERREKEKVMQWWEEKAGVDEEEFKENLHEMILRQIQRKLAKGKSVADIAEALDTDNAVIENMIAEL